MSQTTRRSFLTTGSAVLLGGGLSTPALAASRSKIDRRTRSAISLLRDEVQGGSELLDQAAGVLLMPRVRRAGLGFGGAYGEGSFLIGEAPVDYYSVAAASFGLQIGIQQYSSALFFMSEDRVSKFRRRDGWTIGADLEYTAWNQGDVADIDTQTGPDRVYGLVFGQEGLHVGLTLEGSKYSLIRR